MYIQYYSNLKFNKEGKYDWSNDHFNKAAYLTVSSQLQLEALACGLGNVYTTNKSFRSVKSSKVMDYYTNNMVIA